MFCQDATLVNDLGETRQIKPLYCRSWQCPECRPRRRASLIAAAKSGNPNTFITLTVNPKWGGSPYQRARGLADAWRTIVAKATRRWGNKRIPYLAVFEKTKAGEPHLHILARSAWIDQGWLSDQLEDAIGAPVVDIRRIRKPSQVAGYVAKYVGKTPHRFETCKRYWSTRDFIDGKWREGRKRRRRITSWRLDPTPFADYVARLLHQGWALYAIDPATFRRYRPQRGPP